MFQQYAVKDNWYGNILTWIGAGTTSIILQAWQGARFPTANFPLTLVQYTTTGDETTPIVKREKVLCITRSTDTLLVTRWFDGDTPTGFDAGDNVYLNVVSAMVNDIYTEVARLETAKLNITDYQNWTKVYASSSTWNDSYAITLSPVPWSYSVGMVFRFLSDVGNTGAATLNVNALGAKTIKKLHDQDLVTGDIEAGQIVVVVYDGTYFQMDSQVATIPTVDISWETEDTGGDIDNDFVHEYDTSAGANRKLKPSRWAATNAEAAAWSATNKFLLPSQLKYAGSAPTAWTSVLVASYATEVTQTGTTYVKKYEWTMLKAWTYTVAFDQKRQNWGSGWAAYARVYKNWVAFGTERSTTSTTDVNRTENLTFAAGDVISLYMKAWVAWTSDISYVNDFTVKCDQLQFTLA